MLYLHIYKEARTLHFVHVMMHIIQVVCEYMKLIPNTQADGHGEKEKERKKSQRGSINFELELVHCLQQ